MVLAGLQGEVGGDEDRLRPQPAQRQVFLGEADVVADGAAEAERIWALLSEDGQVFMPMGETFFAIRFGQLRDKFGISWMILAPKPQPS